MFWRNESTQEIAPSNTGRHVLQESLADMRRVGQAVIPEVMDTMLTRSLPRAIEQEGLRLSAGCRWLPQEVNWSHPIFRINLVLDGADRTIVNSVVNGGISLWLETNGHISGEICGYYHRLVCTNGLMRKVQGVGRIEAVSVDECSRQLAQALPVVLRGISAGLDAIHRSAQARLGLLRPLIPVVLDYMEIRDPYRALILDAFAQEPGDSLWHFINAFSRAANLVMVAQGIPPAVALRKRYQLQHAGVRVCDGLLAVFTEGRSLIDSTAELKDLLHD